MANSNFFDRYPSQHMAYVDHIDISRVSGRLPNP